MRTKKFTGVPKPLHSQITTLWNEFGRENVSGPETDKPSNVIQYNLMLNVWPEDDFLDSYAAYAITSQLAQALQKEQVTGIEIHPMKVSKGDQFWIYEKDHPGVKIPELVWLKVVGEPTQDDFGELSGPGAFSLIVSEKALNVIKQFKHANARIFDYVAGGERPMSEFLREFMDSEPAEA